MRLTSPHQTVRSFTERYQFVRRNAISLPTLLSAEQQANLSDSLVDRPPLHGRTYLQKQQEHVGARAPGQAGGNCGGIKLLHP